MQASETPVFKRFSRFNRDASAWIAISDAVLWNLALSACDGKTEKVLNCWSCGCSSGEEAYYLRMIWQKRLASIFTDVSLHVLGTDLSEDKVAAAQEGSYLLHSVKALPPSWLQEFFIVPKSGTLLLEQSGGLWASRSRCAKVVLQQRKEPSQKCLESEFPDDLWLLSNDGVRQNVSFLQQDVTKDMPDGPFDLVMSRYAVCLYLAGEQKAEVLTDMVARLRPGGFLIIGEKEKLPPGFCEQNGLIQFSYSVKKDGYGILQLLEGIYQKFNEDASSQKSRACADLPASCSCYSQFLQSLGHEPDWVIERERRWRELTQQKTSQKSAEVLARAVKEGRRDENISLVDRMLGDYEARQERARVRMEEREELQAALSINPSLSKEEASTKVQQFFERLQRDMQNREAAKKRAEKAELIAAKQARTTSKSFTAGRRRRRGRRQSKCKTMPILINGECTEVEDSFFSETYSDRHSSYMAWNYRNLYPNHI